MTDQVAMVDRITDLPWDTLDNIFGRLAIEDSVRTTMLSRKWRDKWTDISKLVFDEQAVAESKLANIIYRVLLSHRGPIDKFMLTTEYFNEANHLDNWILFLSRNNIKELVLDMQITRHYKLPSCLFSCQHLSHLSVTNCFVVIPPVFAGFQNLVSLQLKGFRSDDTEIESLICCCPLLEKLVLSGFSYDPKCLNIYAPNLRSLYLKGQYNDVYLANSSHVTDATFKMTKRAERRLDGVAKNLVVPNCQSHFERLTLSGHFVKVLSTKSGPDGIFFACDNLKVLELSKVHFNKDIFKFILSILKTSTNLKELTISIMGDLEEDTYEFIRAQDQVSYCFDQLRVVKINITILVSDIMADEYNWRSDLELIKLVLACSPILEKMVVHYADADADAFFDNMWLMEQLLSFKRASTNLIFKYFDS